MKIENILERKDVVQYLLKRNLIAQYKKAKTYILAWNQRNSDLQERKPKGSKVYYFRINKQFRAIWYIEDNLLIIVKIDNHQD